MVLKKEMTMNQSYLPVDILGVDDYPERVAVRVHNTTEKCILGIDENLIKDIDGVSHIPVSSLGTNFETKMNHYVLPQTSYNGFTVISIPRNHF